MKCIAIVLAGAAVLASGAVHAQTPEELRQDSVVASAERAALAWLKQVDAGEWEATHARMAPMLRNATTVEAFRETVRQARAPIEPLGARELVAVQRGHPMFGDAALSLSFRVATEASSHATETVILVPSDGGWSIGGYGVRR